MQELLDHLESMLSNEAVIVTVGQAIVEVKPQVCSPPMRWVKVACRLKKLFHSITTKEIGQCISRTQELIWEAQPLGFVT